MEYILVASRNEEACKQIGRCLKGEFNAKVVSTPQACLSYFKKQRYDMTFIDVDFLNELMRANGLSKKKDVLHLFWKSFPAALIVVLAPLEQMRPAVEFVKAGAGNYLTCPIDATELEYVIESTFEANRLESELDYFRSNFWMEDPLDFAHTDSPAMKEVYDKVLAVASTKTTVLLTGETGTGKSLLAKFIHAHSYRKDNVFMSVHCGSLPDTLVESELFGHEKGAFTGATRRKLGKFEIAQGGTLVLDEVGTITPAAQIKLLQILQEKSFQRIGGETTIESDVRVIAATNMDLKDMCDQGSFRKDLYYRLNVFPVELVPLRKRIEDIPRLADVFIGRLNLLYNKEIQGVLPEVIDALQSYSWPGNIREMEHLFERAYVLEQGALLTPESFPIELFTEDTNLAPIPVETSRTLSEARSIALSNFEQQYLQEVLSSCNGRIDKTAQSAGISTRQLHKLLKKHQIDKKAFKHKP